MFIGSGKVATSLAINLKNANDIVQVYSKSLANAQLFGKKLKCTFTDDLKKITLDADLYIIAVKDEVLENVCKKLRLQGKTVIHTSGSTELSILKNLIPL